MGYNRVNNQGMSGPSRHLQKRRAHWDEVARQSDAQVSYGRYYNQRLTEIYQFLIPPGRKVIEIGCGTGDLLAALKPAVGVGVDFSAEMLRRAILRHPDLRFVLAEAHDLNLKETFDFVILSDLLNEVWDVQVIFQRVKELTHSGSRIIINSYSHLWQLPLGAVRRLGLARPVLDQNWLTVEDLENLLQLEDFEVIRHWSEILLPLDIPLLTGLLNRFLVKLWPFRYAALTNFMVARPKPRRDPAKEPPKVSVIIPSRNESGNIKGIFERVPEMGAGTELIFVEGHSQDDTYEVINQTIGEYPSRRAFLYRQTGDGKGDAVRLGFEKAGGDILMILDADLTVPPEFLPRFYEALVSGRAEFANGVRLLYPMAQQAMRFFNLVGNKFFSKAFSWLLGQTIKDTLCGTKALWKDQYWQIGANRTYFGDFDPFGDFDLIFGAAKLNLKITDIPVRYGERDYGNTNIRRWKHGLLLLRMLLLGARRLKFV